MSRVSRGMSISRSETFVTIVDTSESSSDESQLKCEPIRLEVGEGNFNKPNPQYCILRVCLPCIETLTQDWHFELIYLLVHLFSGVPIVYIVVLSQALDEIVKGHHVGYEHINVYSWFWLVLSLLLLVLRIIIWVWRTLSVKFEFTHFRSSPRAVYRSGCPYRQTIYAITLILYIINMCYSIYWQHSPNSIVIACAVLIFLDVIGYCVDIVVFCVSFPTGNPSTTLETFEERRLTGNE